MSDAETELTRLKHLRRMMEEMSRLTSEFGELLDRMRRELERHETKASRPRGTVR